MNRFKVSTLLILLSVISHSSNLFAQSPVCPIKFEKKKFKNVILSKGSELQPIFKGLLRQANKAGYVAFLSRPIAKYTYASFDQFYGRLDRVQFQKGDTVHLVFTYKEDTMEWVDFTPYLPALKKIVMVKFHDRWQLYGPGLHKEYGNGQVSRYTTTDLAILNMRSRVLDLERNGVAIK